MGPTEGGMEGSPWDGTAHCGQNRKTLPISRGFSALSPTSKAY